MKGGCGFPMGPFSLLDLVGLDTSVAILDALYEEFHDPELRPRPDAAAHGHRQPPRPQDRPRLLQLRPLAPGRRRTSSVAAPGLASGTFEGTRASHLIEPIEPPPTRWRLPQPVDGPDDLIGIGADLEPGTLLAAYRRGLFPMPVRRRRLGLVVARPARRPALRRPAGHALAAAVGAPLRAARRHGLPGGDDRLRPVQPAGRLDHARVRRRLPRVTPSGLGPQRRSLVAGRPARRRAVRGRHRRAVRR